MGDYKVCGNCTYCKPSRECGRLTGWFCMNVESDNYGYSMEYNDTCEEFEER